MSLGGYCSCYIDSRTLRERRFLGQDGSTPPPHRTDFFLANNLVLDGLLALLVHRQEPNAKHVDQKIVRDLAQAALVHHFLNPGQELGAQVLPLGPLSELLHTAALQF